MFSLQMSEHIGCVASSVEIWARHCLLTVLDLSKVLIPLLSMMFSKPRYCQTLDLNFVGASATSQSAIFGKHAARVLIKVKFINRLQERKNDYQTARLKKQIKP